LILSRFLTGQATISETIFLLRNLSLSNKTFLKKLAFTNRCLAIPWNQPSIGFTSYATF
jgi:hypothetical protein